MASRELIIKYFNDLGIEIDDNDAVLDKCVEVSVLRGVDEETFVETWMAYSLTHLDGAPPTVDSISQMERKEFLKRDLGTVTSSTQSTTPLVVYNKTPSTKHKTNYTHDLNTTPKGRGQDTERCASVSHSLFSPASFSPTVATPSSMYTNRTNAGRIVCSYGKKGEEGSSAWQNGVQLSLSISSYCDEPLRGHCRFMMECLSDKRAILNDVIERLKDDLIKNNNLPEPLHFCNISAEVITCVGRVCCDSESHLNAASVVLEGAHSVSSGRTIRLDLSKLKNCALFPGQIIAVQGVNPTGGTLIAHKICTSAMLPSPVCPPRINGTLSIVVAAGPFTQTDNLMYQPLEDLAKYVVEHKPHVLLLTGPFVDSSHGLISDGSLAETYQALYEKIITGFMESLKGTWTHVIVVTSSQDAVAAPIYPTPPAALKKSLSLLQIVSDPSMLSINGLVVGITSVDILMHLGKQELSFSAGDDRLGRLASHLIQQQNFYPLYPPIEDFLVDMDLWESHSWFSVTPHILIIPSDLRYFIKHINNCVVINPEHLAKGLVGGSFARIEVEPDTDGNWQGQTHISAQVIKI